MGIIDRFLYDEETRDNIWVMRVSILILILFCVSAFKSCREVKYTLFGEQTVARVTKVKDVAVSSRAAPRSSVYYEFTTAEGKKVEGNFRLPTRDWVMPPNRQLEIVYVNGMPVISVPVEERSAFWIVVLIVMTVLGSLAFYNMMRKASQGRL